MSDPLLDVLVERHGEDGHRLYLERLRWADGVRCPRCASDRIAWLDARHKHNCRDCRYQFRVTAGTVLHDSHVTLGTWLLAVALVVDSERGYPATHLWKQIGGSYKTAWFVEHRIRAALAEVGDVGPVVALGGGGAGWAGVARRLPARTSQHDDAPPTWLVLRRLIGGSYRTPSTKYLSAYWNEARWRAAHGRDGRAFREAVTALLNHPPLTYEELTAPDDLPNDDEGKTT